MWQVLWGALKSKGVWLGVLTIIFGALVPPVQEYIAAHPGPVATVLGVLIIAVRSLTTQSLAMKGAKKTPLVPVSFDPTTGGN